MNSTAVKPAVLTLTIEIPTGPDWVQPQPNLEWPATKILVDGADVIQAAGPGQMGFDPAEVFGPDRPLVPVAHPRRVALYRCGCLVPGCGSIAPTIGWSADGRAVEWRDFRRYTGVFDGPMKRRPLNGGVAVDVADLQFGREQYLSEVARAAADRSWETPRRATARILMAKLADDPMALRIYPAWDGPGLIMTVRRDGDWTEFDLPVIGGTPIEQAEQLAPLISRRSPQLRRRCR